MPIGYPPTTSGVELRLLKFLFTPEQAGIALELDYKFKTVAQIYERVQDWGISKKELETKLEEMADKGNTFCRKVNGAKAYANIPFIIGMLEFQVKRLTPEFLINTSQYVQEKFAEELLGTKIPQTRVIPIEKSITSEHRIGTYDELRNLIHQAEDRIRIGECFCRKSMAMEGHKCSVTSRKETCMAFRDFADMAGRTGWGRPISKQKALEIAAKNEKDGMILQPSNEQEPQFICSCCGDCCGILRIAKAVPRPAEVLASNYYAQGDPDLCDGCGTCVDRCQMEAVELQDDVAVVNRDRCIGCGLCVSTCPSETIYLVKKKKEVIPPKNTESLYETIMEHKKFEIKNSRLT